MDETALLQRIARGDRGAVTDCIETYGGLVWSLARRFIDSPADAEEAVQDVFMELWECAARFDPLKAEGTTFVAMIARRRLIDRQRSGRRGVAAAKRFAAVGDAALRSSGTVQTEQQDPAPGPPALLQRSEETRRVRNALAELRPEQRDVIHLYCWRGLSHAAIAEHTGLPLGTVKSHLRRGFERIRLLLGAGTTSGSST